MTTKGRGLGSVRVFCVIVQPQLISLCDWPALYVVLPDSYWLRATIHFTAVLSDWSDWFLQLVPFSLPCSVLNEICSICTVALPLAIAFMPCNRPDPTVCCSDCLLKQLAKTFLSHWLYVPVCSDCPPLWLVGSGLSLNCFLNWIVPETKQKLQYIVAAGEESIQKMFLKK